MPYTSALFVALPADESIAPEAHVTLSYFGEADGLTSETLKLLGEEIEWAAQNFAPFTADVAGTAVIGEDKVSVLLLESFTLVEIRDSLRGKSVVGQAELNAEKRFPSWIPHMTTSYDALPMEDPPTQIEIDALGFWCAGEKTSYPLVGTGAAVMASAVCIPEIMCLEDLALGLRYASAHPGARWYVMKRAAALGVPDRIPTQWSRT